MLIASYLSLVFIATVSGAAIHSRNDPNDLLNYDCTSDPKGDMTEICMNMCYGVNCRDFPFELYWDKPDKATSTARAKKAGCGGKNRCSTDPKYGSAFQCDEYPFRSVDTSNVPLPVNRCVHSEQNRAQSNVLKQFYYSQGVYKGVGLGGKPGSFRLAFANYGGIRYCGETPDCTNDGNEYNKNGEVPNALSKRDSVFARSTTSTLYVTQTGKEIHVPGGAKAGDRVWTPKSYDGDMEFDLDYVVGLSNSTRS